MSILNSLKSLETVSDKPSRVEMTPEQVAQCKSAIRSRKLGYNVHPNKYDIATPYRVAINFDNQWSNFGDFACADTAAAVGSIVAVAYFGAEKAKRGEYNQETAEANKSFNTWLNDERNVDVIARATGSKPSFFDEKSGDTGPTSSAGATPTGDNPFLEEGQPEF